MEYAHTYAKQTKTKVYTGFEDASGVADSDLRIIGKRTKQISWLNDERLPAT